MVEGVVVVGGAPGAGGGAPAINTLVDGVSPVTGGGALPIGAVVGGGAPAAGRHQPPLILNYLITIFIIILFK
jgi:hypothetical protein